ncbi:hypothetical protein Tco_0850221, partial [Tanacetum coccineum]
DNSIDMPLFHRPEIPQRVLPRRCIDYLRFRKSFSSMSLSISNSLSDDGAMEEDSATFWALSSWGYEAVKREPNPRFGLRVKRVIKKLQKDVWVEGFLGKLRVTEQRRRLLSLEFRRREYREGHILNFTYVLLEAIGILPDERGEILRVVALLRDH